MTLFRDAGRAAQVTVRRVIASWILLGLTASAGFSACAPDILDLRGSWGQAQFQIEIADTDASRAQGLMHRTEMPRMAGMLFVYDSPRPMAFWMRNTLIPLDLLFIAPSGEILLVHEQAIPLDETPIPGPDDAIAVLEINGGMAKTLGIRAGDEVRHIFFDQFSNSWPCDAS
ncbi:DUF192 domain-containing protein [Falsihalocynthiibacter sp. SS001]|uniref:DUF192 domain-containing protein n=1 Tax=Falsihalocynthiibacter sp. SS001 TaxID=3349698 RepID=UPI0036D3AD04